MLSYALAIFLGAFLIFQVQPFVGKYILPWFGGTPSVWSTCMLFFQTLLLAGYLYAHIVATRLRPRAQAVVHSLLLVGALGILLYQWLAWGAPVLPGASFKPPDSEMPTLRLLLLLVASVGLPYFILSSTGPLVQSWFNRGFPGRSPYRLYVLSNTGSLLALVSYPFVIEPLLKLNQQAAVWSFIYGAFVVAMVVTAVRLARGRKVPHPRMAAQNPDSPSVTSSGDAAAEMPVVMPKAEEERKPEWSLHMLWFGLAAVASAMLLAATNQICQEIAVIPFLWILPLTLYLLSFIFVFNGDHWYSRKWWGIAFAVTTVIATAALFDAFALPIMGQVLVFSAVLFALCMVSHGEMVALKPAPRHLTSFYLMMSAGGAFGGAFVSLLAPILFNGFFELHLSLWAAWALFLLVLWREQGSWVNAPGLVALKKVMLGGLLLLAAVLYGHTRYAHDDAVLCERNFYGVLRVRQMRWEDPKWRAYKLSHGAIVHGFQYVAPKRRKEPASYYGDKSGIALVLKQYPQQLEERTGRTALRIGVVGLGVGTLAVFGDADDTFRFYEINPSVTALSTGEEPYFTYLRDAAAKVEVVDGDARISLERELAEGHSQEFDVLAIDAFSSDSIPAHLLTQEALALYLEHLRPDGVLAMHISNRHLDLRPVVAGLAAGEGLEARIIDAAGREEGHWGSTWAIITRNEDFLKRPAIRKACSKKTQETSGDVWTDDYSNIFELL